MTEAADVSPRVEELSPSVIVTRGIRTPIESMSTLSSEGTTNIPSPTMNVASITDVDE